MIFTVIAGISSIHSSWNTTSSSDSNTALKANDSLLDRNNPLPLSSEDIRRISFNISLLQSAEFYNNQALNKKISIGILIQQKASSMALLVQSIDSRRSSGILNEEQENKMNEQVLQIDKQYSHFINVIAKVDRELERQKKANQLAARKNITQKIKEGFKSTP